MEFQKLPICKISISGKFHKIWILISRKNLQFFSGTAFENNPLFSIPAQKSQASLSSSSSTSNSSIFYENGVIPKAKPRVNKNREKQPKTTFKSHVVENWEEHSPMANRRKDEKSEKSSTFKSHVPVGNLLDL